MCSGLNKERGHCFNFASSRDKGNDYLFHGYDNSARRVKILCFVFVTYDMHPALTFNHVMAKTQRASSGVSHALAVAPLC